MSLLSESKNNVSYIRVLCLLLGTPNTKYLPITNNYLRCLLFGGFSNRGKGLVWWLFDDDDDGDDDDDDGGDGDLEPLEVYDMAV